MINIFKKVAIWGDSLLKGIVLDDNKEGYHILDENCVKLSAATLGLDISNNSRFGCTAPKGSILLERSMKKELNIDAAIIEFGGNDCDYDWDIVSAQPEKEHFPKTTIEMFKKSYNEMIDKLKAKSIIPILMTLPPIDSIRYFNWITSPSTRNKNNILKFLGDIHHIYRHHERYSMAITSVAKSRNCPLIDIREAFLARKDCLELICDDGIHPNERGHIVMKECFMKFAVETNYLT